MHVNAPVLYLSMPVLMSLGMLLCRTAAFLVFLPIPGLRGALETSRLILALLFAILLAPFARPSPIQSLPAMAAGVVSEAALGIALGLCVGVILEGLQLAGQLIGLQAGFSYASTVDPSSEADSAILQVLFTLAGSLLFFVTGFDTVLFRFLLLGVQTVPPGEWVLHPDHAVAILSLFPPLFTDAIRISLPVVAVLLLIDVTLALFSRVQPQLQLLSLSFPLKMLAAIVIVALGSASLTPALERPASRSLEVIASFLRARPAP